MTLLLTPVENGGITYPPVFLRCLVTVDFAETAVKAESLAAAGYAGKSGKQVDWRARKGKFWRWACAGSAQS